MRNILIATILIISISGCNTTKINVLEENTYLDEDIVQIANIITKISPIESNVLITDFTDLDGVITHFGRYLSEKTNNYLSNINEIHLVDRNSIELILKEQALQSSGVTQSEDIVEIGELTGADIIIKGIITEFKEYVEIGISSINISTGTILASDSYKLLKNYQVSQLIGNIVKTQEQIEIELEEYRQKIMEDIEKEKNERINELKQEENKLLVEIDVLEEELREKSIIIAEYEAKKQEAYEKDEYIRQLHEEIDDLNYGIAEKLKIGMLFSQVEELLGKNSLHLADRNWYGTDVYISGGYFLFFDGNILIKGVRNGSRNDVGNIVSSVCGADTYGINSIKQ